MATKTISLRLEAYDKLCEARRFEGESFSQVVLRAQWPESTITAKELLHRNREGGPLLPEAAWDRIEEVKRTDRPPENKWASR